MFMDHSHQLYYLLWDFDGYDYRHTTLYEVLNNPKKKMGHAFVLAALLKNKTKPLCVK